MKTCVLRECREELGIEIRIDKLYAEFSYAYPDRDIHFSFFLAEILSGTVKMRVHSDLKWVFPCELQKYDFCPADQNLILRLIRNSGV
jgi:mutator protein MutT